VLAVVPAAPGVGFFRAVLAAPGPTGRLGGVTLTDQHPRLSQRQVRSLLAGLMTGMLLAALDQTIVGVALPTIVGELGGIEHYSWVVTAYLLAATASIPLYGKVSDLIGRRPVFLFALVTFLVGSALAGASQTMGHLIAARGVQGVGAGGLMTLAFVIISDAVTPRERGRYQGLFGAVFGVATVIGPLVGGYFTEHDWRWIFYLNIPLGLLAIVVASRVIRMLPVRRREHVLDWPGAVLLVAGVICLLLALSWGGNQYPWRSPVILGLLAAGSVLAVLFLLQERRTSEPILPISLFRRRTFALANTGIFVLGLAMFGSIIFLPLYLQIVQGASPTRSGMLMLPMMGAIIITSVATGRAMSHFGRYKWFPAAGSATLLVGLLLLARLDEVTPLAGVTGAMVVVGVGLGLCMQSLILAVQNAVDLRDLGAGTSAATFFRTLGGSFGVAVLGAVLAAGLTGGLRDRMPEALAQLPPEQARQYAHLAGSVSVDEPAAILALPEPLRVAVQESLVGSLQTVFLVAALVVVIAVVATFSLPDHPLRGPAPDHRPNSNSSI
jgi:EmrB/QacA subfamily drug resistance transporter